MKEEIEKYLRLNGKKQSFICELLKLSQPSVSAKINGRQIWFSWEIDILKENKIIQ
jgi:predicted XRE-type DNA-binding protein